MDSVFNIVPAPARASWLLGGICLLLAVLTLVFAWLWISIRGEYRFTLGEHTLTISDGPHGRVIPYQTLKADSLEIIELDQQHPLRPRWKRMGTGLPGFQGGWFSLANGDKALVFLTRREQVVHMKTNEGYHLLMSVDGAEYFVEELEKRLSHD